MVYVKKRKWKTTDEVVTKRKFKGRRSLHGPLHKSRVLRRSNLFKKTQSDSASLFLIDAFIIGYSAYPVTRCHLSRTLES